MKLKTLNSPRNAPGNSTNLKAILMGFAFEKVSPFTNQQFPFKQKN
jgi:hypothetical protein